MSMRNRKIGVLAGGMSSERAVSIETGEAVLSALCDLGYDASIVFVDRDVDIAIRQAEIDIAFNALHGRYGEDGCIQGLLETLGIPYTGSDVLASALAMNKVKAKEIFRLHNLPTPHYYVLWEQGNVLAQHSDFGFPAVVKPLGEGSSIGVSIVHDAEELLSACEQAFCFDSRVLVERFVPGQEVSVAILEDRALGAVEVATNELFYDYSAKYTKGATDYFIPPRISPERYRGILTQGLNAHRAVGASGATRVDMIVSPSGNEYILEVNTLPGMTPTSLLPKVACHAGVPFTELVEAILHGARLFGTARGHGERRVARRSAVKPERRTESVVEHH